MNSWHENWDSQTWIQVGPGRFCRSNFYAWLQAQITMIALMDDEEVLRLERIDNGETHWKGEKENK